MPNLLASSDPLEHVLPHRFGDWHFHWPTSWTSPLDIVTVTPHDTYFTNHILMTIVAAGIMLLVFPRLGRRYAAIISDAPTESVPSGFASLIESMMQFIRNEVARPVLGQHTDRFMPFLWTVFFYILTCNLLGMIPLDSIIAVATGGRLQHVGGTATGNIMITAGLAACSFLMIHFSGMKQIFGDLVTGEYGHHAHEPVVDHDHRSHDRHASGIALPIAVILAPFLYLWNFAPHVFAPEKTDSLGAILLWLADIVMWAVLLVLEGIGALIKAFALSIRLFANMVAGHVVLASILALILTFEGLLMTIGGGLIVALGCAALSCLELFVAFLQAYIFTFLTTLFLGASIAPEH